MFLKKIKSLIAIFMIATFIMPLNTFAYSDYIIAGGENVGLQINNKGIIIAGFYDINNISPGIDAKLSKGDTIVKVDNKEVYTINDFIDTIKTSNGKNIELIYLRNNTLKKTNLNLINDKGVVKTGLYVKDMVSGIGTLTFIDPNTKLFGALGHEVIENSSGVMINVKDGKIYNSNVTGIEKSIRGEPGAKNARVNAEDVYGTIKENTISGIFGNYIKNVNNNNLYKVASYKDIKVGEAKIITVLNKDEKKEYSINILRVNDNKKDNKNILFEITDNELIEKTGGIVQGMSGSPIIQDKNIIGAVTNVVVNNPKRGYGILITTMLEEAEN